MKRPGKLRFRRSMTAIAQNGLRFDQQMLGFFCMVRRVTVEASHIVAVVRGSSKVRLRLALTVAAQTPGIRFLSRQVFHPHNLADVTATRDVLGTRAMTRLAALAIL